MDSLVGRLSRARKFAHAMDQETKAVDLALPAVRGLLSAAGVPYLIVGGLAVVHHGYLRTTEDIDLLVGRDALARLGPLLAAHGFERIGDSSRLRHVGTGVRIDLLVEGHTIAKPGAEPFPAPENTPASERDADVASLAALVTLKLQAKRHQDLADVVALLKPLDDAGYIALEASIPAKARPELARLRDDALEELSYERE